MTTRSFSLFCLAAATILWVSAAYAQANQVVTFSIKYGPQAQDEFHGNKVCTGFFKSEFEQMRKSSNEEYKYRCSVREDSTVACRDGQQGIFDPATQEFRIYRFSDGSISGGDATPTVLYIIAGKLGSQQGYYEIRRINTELATREMYRVGPDKFRMIDVQAICTGRMPITL